MTGQIYKTGSTITNSNGSDELFCLNINNSDVPNGSCVRKIRLFSDNNEWLKNCVVLSLESKNSSLSDWTSIPRSQYQKSVLDYSIPKDFGSIDNENWKVFVLVPALTKFRYDIFLSHATI